MKPRIKVTKASATLAAPAETGYEEITLAEQAYRLLRQDIISGALPADRALRLEYLKARCGISYSPLREALNRLHTEQLVVSTTSRGFRVAPISEEEMWDVIETRIVIDCEALRRSLARGDDAWEARLVAAFHALTLASPDRMALVEERHHDFHRSLIAACGSRWMLNLSAQLHVQTERYRQPSLRDSRYGKHGRDVGSEHRQLLDAAIARDAALATGLLAQHYRATGRIMQKILAQALAGATRSGPSPGKMLTRTGTGTGAAGSARHTADTTPGTAGCPWSGG